MTRRSLFIFAAALSLSVAGYAWAKPNFTGTWKINAAKSDFGPMPQPDKMERTITHDDPSLKYTTVQTTPNGEVTSDATYKTDGSDTTNKVRGMDVKGNAKWAGDALTISSKREFQGMEITQVESWTLAEGGKQLVINNKVNTPQGDFDLKFVFDKQ